jgi:hypothetical protein
MSHTAWAFCEGHAFHPIYGHYAELYRSRKGSFLNLGIFVISLLDSDDESDADVVDVTSQEVNDSPSGAGKGNKRPRSRSRSLTPPPQLSMQQILNVRNVVR